MEEIVDPRQIDAAQQQIDRDLKDALPAQGAHKLGFRGGGKKLLLYSLGRNNLYYASEFIDRNDTAPRHWNAFGFYDGNRHGTQRIAVEINIPKPASRRVAGFFGRDMSSNDILLLHDGKLGGGKEGVNKSAFLNHSGFRPVAVQSPRRREGVVIATLGSTDLIKDIERFVRAVAAFKVSV